MVGMRLNSQKESGSAGVQSRKRKRPQRIDQAPFHFFCATISRVPVNQVPPLGRIPEAAAVLSGIVANCPAWPGLLPKPRFALPVGFERALKVELTALRPARAPT
jgi:hypothetical protein